MFPFSVEQRNTQQISLRIRPLISIYMNNRVKVPARYCVIILHLDSVISFDHNDLKWADSITQTTDALPICSE